MNRFLIPADCGPILESLIFTTHWCGTLLQESKINGLIRSNKKRDERFRTRPPHTHTQTRIKWPLTGDLTTFYWKYKKRYFDHHHENFNRSVVLSIPNKGTNWNLRTTDEILPASLYWRLAHSFDSCSAAQVLHTRALGSTLAQAADYHVLFSGTSSHHSSCQTKRHQHHRRHHHHHHSWCSGNQTGRDWGDKLWRHRRLRSRQNWGKGHFFKYFFDDCDSSNVAH